jgi:hypothetical protein
MVQECDYSAGRRTPSDPGMLQVGWASQFRWSRNATIGLGLPVLVQECYNSAGRTSAFCDIQRHYVQPKTSSWKSRDEYGCVRCTTLSVTRSKSYWNITVLHVVASCILVHIYHIRNSTQQ